MHQFWKTQCIAKQFFTLQWGDISGDLKKAYLAKLLWNHLFRIYGSDDIK